ncbi:MULTISPECIES: hypothetical protein [Lactobacillus]|uniref:hypothetical protein n=1 Tax=Lactobacillus TaxID=1578 RepID=UPI000BEEF44F|nr:MULTISPECIES: hypothetical protein [Lactobacillus]MBM6958789.1 hypothetical protein [Lactobacillus gallinarum]MCC9271632.1 hypothetical protein [Lactobacillus gallinarum]MDM8276701.1 hypothetical protein [Lactobacillus gallinarum]PEG87107.1 hypothetical protein CP365_04255 [Lactobacillus sp. UMNPBX14]PEH02621.1 hypothetical protein CP357_04435 [Lactobacillus sp. UMNPBX6]
MTDKEILQKIEQGVKNSENWEVYHHLTDNLGSPALMLRKTNTNADRLGVNIDVFKGYAYLFLDNGTPAEPGKPFSVQTLTSLNALTELLDIVKPYIKRN